MNTFQLRTRLVATIIVAVSFCIQMFAQNRVCARSSLKTADSLAITLAANVSLGAIQSSDVDSLGKSPVWTYVYFSFDTSNFRNSKAYYIIVQNNQATFDHWDSLGVGPFMLFAWWMDSDSALAIAQLAGGSDICKRHPGSTINASLHQWPAPPFISEWRIAYHSSDSIRTIRVDGTNGQILTGLSSPGTLRPLQFQLDQNFPNPFNPSTTITFALPSSSPVSLTLFDGTGRQVATLVNKELSAGYHSTRLVANRFSSGFYFYRLQTRWGSQTKKCVFLK